MSCKFHLEVRDKMLKWKRMLIVNSINYLVIIVE